MKQENNGAQEKRTLWRDWKLFWRGARIWGEMIPHFWTFRFICILLETFSPYFALYMSAQMVNELAGACDVKRLLMLAGVTVAGGFGLTLVNRVFAGYRDVQTSQSWFRHEAFMMNAQNGIQYNHLEDPEIVLKKSRLFSWFVSFGGGIYKVMWIFPELLRDILNIVFSVALTVSMFTMAAEGTFTGIWAFVNSPVSMVAVLALIFINVILSIKLSVTSTQQYEAAVEGLAESNTLIQILDRLTGADMVVFGLNRIVMAEKKKDSFHPEWVEKSQKISIRYKSLSVLLNAAVNLSIFLFTAAKAFIGVFGIGNFILYQGTVQKFIGAVSDLAGNVGMIRNNNKYLIELYEYLDLPNDMYRGTLAVEKRDDLDYEIEFRDVSFRYARTEAWALRHVNARIKIGEKLAIVGENGSGKTTFIKLLCRLYDPTEGKILLNGIDISRYRYDEYMKLFSVVFQDYNLFGFTIGDNIAALGAYDEAKARDCLTRVGMGEKLAALDREADEKNKKDEEEEKRKEAQQGRAGRKSELAARLFEAGRKKSGLDWAIGRDYENDGVDLSGGERQKVALARALYKDAPFMILDEPTAALDPISEAAVYEDFDKIVQDKTSVFISHRLSSCRFCDRIAVFDCGSLVQEGSHEALVSDADGKYSQLWTAQAKYYQK